MSIDRVGTMALILLTLIGCGMKKPVSYDQCARKTDALSREYTGDYGLSPLQRAQDAELVAKTLKNCLPKNASPKEVAEERLDVGAALVSAALTLSELGKAESAKPLAQQAIRSLASVDVNSIDGIDNDKRADLLRIARDISATGRSTMP